MFFLVVLSLHYKEKQLIIKTKKMEAQEKYLDNLIFNLKIWNKDVKSHRNQLNKFQEKLQEVSERNNGLEVKQGVEQFQNRIIIENEVIDTLSHKLKAKKKELLNADLNSEVDGSLKKSLGPIREEVKVFTKLNQELQHEISDFFMEWL